MSRLNRYACLETFAVLSFCYTLSMLAVSQTSLETVRGIYRQYTPENFDDGGEISHYVWKNSSSFFLQATVARTQPERSLNNKLYSGLASAIVDTESGQQRFETYVENSQYIDGLIVLAGGQIIFESYPNMEAYDRHLSWSITKVVVSTALAALESQGRVNVDRAASDYLPDLIGSDWQGISLRDIVNMASGIDCLDSDGYQNTETCIYRYEESLGLTAAVNPAYSTLENLRLMRRHRPSGEKYEYVSADTFVTGLVVESITGKPLWLALQGLIWEKIGAEADALMMINAAGIPASHGGLSARLLDLARFGEIFTSDDYLGVVSASHLADLASDKGIAFDEAQIAQLTGQFNQDVPKKAAWQWDMIWTDGAMFKGGYSGQGIFVDPGRDFVAVWYGTSGIGGQSHQLLPLIRKLSKDHGYRENTGKYRALTGGLPEAEPSRQAVQ